MNICVLMATHNGVAWLDQQIDSILRQENIEVTIVVSDDGSTDGTRELLERRATNEPRIKLLQHDRRFGSAAANFFHLLIQADTQRYEFFAFADQDDIWLPGKLRHHADALRTLKAHGVSSDVTAFWPDGREVLIRKSLPQRRFDDLMEPPGPGCTFLMRAELVRRCQVLILQLRRHDVSELDRHDWFVYLVARRSGFRWHIDAWPSVLYRQHGRNEIGANVGWRAAVSRVRALCEGAYRRRVKSALLLALWISRLQSSSAKSLEVSALDILFDGRRNRVEGLIAAAFMPTGVRVDLNDIGFDPAGAFDATAQWNGPK